MHPSLAEDLYGPAINTAVKKATCSEALFAHVQPLYDKVCRKKNQDKLLEECYGLIPNAREYSCCPGTNAANIIMIEIPDRLAGFFKISQTREGSAEPTTALNELKLNPSEHGPLSYIAGYIISKLYKESRNRKNECEEEFLALLQALKSTESDNNYILAHSRGGLMTPSHHLMGIVEEAEICFTKKCWRGQRFASYTD